YPQFLVRVLRPISFVRNLLRKGRGPSGHFDHSGYPADTLSWEEFAKRFDPEEAIAAWENTRKQVGLRTPRNASYFQWRYGANPNMSYRIIPHTKATGTLDGFTVVKFHLRRGLREAVLEELVLGGDPDLQLKKG